MRRDAPSFRDEAIDRIRLLVLHEAGAGGQVLLGCLALCVARNAQAKKSGSEKAKYGTESSNRKVSA